MPKAKLNQLEGSLSPTIKIAEKDYLYFGGTAYLGIPQNDAFKKLYIDGINKFGLNNGTSRANNIQLGIYNEAESYAAAYFGTKSALITSSGYLAAQLATKHFLNFGEVRYAPETHPALWQKENYKSELNFKEWAKNVVDEINSSQQNNWVIISNALNNLFPQIYDFSFIQQINQEKKIILIVDDSHGVGVINNGFGIYKSIPKIKHVEVLVVASMAKALGVDAGLILGSSKLINQLKQSDEFLGASPPSAAGLYAFMKAETIYKQEQEKLLHNSALLQNLLANDLNWYFDNEFPVFLCRNQFVAERLFKNNVLISSFPYPDKHGDIINRIVLSSWHNQSVIKKLASYIK
jgi:7-keto-8-aminopelargonate synthetase-like enzyme